MQGAIESLTQRCVQLIKRVKAQPEYTLIGGILRFAAMAAAVEEQLGAPVNVPDEEHVQHVGALGCAILGHRRLEILREKEQAASVA
jgi:activator of 2-hydroxyglutaryl-CoA dehydratase